MVIGFKKQFVEPIQKGVKVHTIREDKANRWKAGMLMHMYTGGRFSKEYHEFAKKQCESVQDIKIKVFQTQAVFGYLMDVRIDGRSLEDYEIYNLAVSDGFDGISDFFDWWGPKCIKMPNETLEAKIIHWTTLKY